MMAFKLRAELRSHSSDVRSVAVSPEGVIATCSRDRSAMIWDIDSTEPQLVLSGHEHFINDIAFLNSSKLVTASADKTLRIWDIRTGKTIQTLSGHTAAVCSVSAFPDGSPYFVSSSWDGTARIWNSETGACEKVLTGHEGSVWSAMALPDGRVITVGADKTVRIWHATGSGPSTILPAVHTDVVRGVIPGPKGSFITVSNDSSMAFWQVRGESVFVSQRMTSLHDDNYIYCVDGMETSLGKWLCVTGGEDNAARISQANYLDGTDAICSQTIMHPGTVWGVALCPNGDFVSACSDGVARVFTADPNSVAAQDILATFEKTVSERQVSTKVIGGVDVAKLPSAADGLSAPGKKDGENKIVRAGNGNAEVHMWSSAESKWVKVGDVVEGPGDGASLGSGTVNNKRYDFVFEVEIGEGGSKEKLGYNRGENPYFAAQRFIDDNELGQDFLDQIAKFIEQQVPADALVQAGRLPSDPLTGGGRYVPGASGSSGATGSDPLTGGSRYVPGGRSANAGSAGTSDPLTGGSRYVPGGRQPSASENLPPPRKLIPHPNGFVTYFNTEQLPKIGGKLKELNTELTGKGFEHALNDDEFVVLESSLFRKLKMRGESTIMLEDSECAVVEKLLKWPTSHAFPVLDIARLVILVPTGVSYYFGKHSGVILDSVLAHLSSASASAAVYIMGCRFLCNIFKNRVSSSLARAKLGAILSAANGASESSNRRARDTYASLLVNFALMLYEENASVDDRSELLGIIIAKLNAAETNDEEVVYRLMTALGTVICGNPEAAKKGLAVGAAASAARVAAVSPRVQQVALEIATVIAS